MARGLLLKDAIRENTLFRNRAIIMGAVAIVLIATLFGRMVYLQVIHHGHFTTLSHNNRVSIRPIAPTRGLIYDRNGVVLAQNLPTFSLEIIPEQVGDMDATLTTLRQLVAISDADIERFRRDLRRKRRFEEIPIRFRLSDEEVARIAVNRHRLPGVEINSRLARHYPLGAETAHIIGYVGRIDERDLRTLDASRYSATTHVGKVGVERAYEEVLHGEVGHQRLETNAQGRVLRVLERSPPVPGSSLHLNLDVRLHREAEIGFGEERGALVAIEPSTGAVLAFVSVPGYDPNMFINGIDRQSFAALSTSRDQPLFNRALQGQYPPGSTVKQFVALAGLESQTFSPRQQVFCPGYYTLDGDDRRYRDWKRRGHGPVGLARSIIESCDVYYYDLAHQLGIDQLSAYMARFGFGRATGIDIAGEAGGLMPSREWKRRARGQPWFPGETLITGIGQGFMLATPLQLATTTSALAMDGARFAPQVVSAIENPQTGELTALVPTSLEPVEIGEPDHWRQVKAAMEEVVHGARGTGRRIGYGAEYRIAGKTGTAQVFGIEQDAEYIEEEVAKRLRDHALFVAYAPADQPHIAVAVIVENGGSGGAVAAPIARRVMDRYLLNNTDVVEDLPYVDAGE